MRPFDAWVLNRLLSNHQRSSPLEEIGRMSEIWRDVAYALLGLEASVRQSAWDRWLARLNERQEIQAMMDTVQPDEPAPPVEATEWPAPEPYRLLCAGSIEAKPVEWLWRGRVPVGMLTLFAGDPKLGKSYVALALAAAVSRGSPLPDSGPLDRPASVIVMSAEDDPARTIVPRLTAAGADRTKIHLFDTVLLDEGRESLPSLRHDISRILAAAQSLGDCRLIVIDPVSAYLGRTDDHRNAELRGVLGPLKSLAEELELAVVLVSHLGKSGSTHGQYRVIGSIAYVGACRSNLLFVRDRTDATGRRVWICDNGGNLGPPAPTLAYAIADRGAGPRVEWVEGCRPITAEEALAAEIAARRQERTDAPERRHAEDWLREVLAGGALPATEIESAARTAGIAYHTLRHAKKCIGAESFRVGFGKDSVCSWRLQDACTE